MPNQLKALEETVTVRQAKPEDAVLLRELRLEALVSDPTAFAADYDISAKETSEKWEERIEENAEQKKGSIYIAETNDLLIGMCGIQRGHWPKTRHSAFIWGVYVNKNWRGFQIARAMIEGCCDWGKAHEIVIVKLGVNIHNEAAIRCYTGCGFGYYGNEPKAVFYENEFIDEFLMVKEL
jgi:RimJ/RimL family protein N-acetyltransferase